MKSYIIKYKNHLIRIDFDRKATNPRHKDNLTFIYCLCEDRVIGDKHDYSFERIKKIRKKIGRVKELAIRWLSFKKYITKKHNDRKGMNGDILNNIAIILPLYIDGSVKIGLDNQSEQNQIGWIGITKDKAKEFMKKGYYYMSYNPKLLKQLGKEIDDYNRYLTNHVYKYSISGKYSKDFGSDCYFEKDEIIIRTKTIIDCDIAMATSKIGYLPFTSLV